MKFKKGYLMYIVLSLLMILLLCIVFAGCSTEGESDPTPGNSGSVNSQSVDPNRSIDPNQSQGAANPSEGNPENTNTDVIDQSGEPGITDPDNTDLENTNQSGETQNNVSGNVQVSSGQTQTTSTSAKITTPKTVTLPKSPAGTVPSYKPPDPEKVKLNLYKNQYVGYSDVNSITSGMQWPKDQIFPIFSPPAATMDIIHRKYLEFDERVTFATLQGLVNKVKPRIAIPESELHDVNAIWYDLFKFKSSNMPDYNASNKYNIPKKYKDTVKGFVLYDPAKSVHYHNLANSIANANPGYIPVTQKVKDNLVKADSYFNFASSKIIDITKLTYTTALDIYQYLYDSSYWKNTLSKRLIVNLELTNADKYANRDIAAAAGAATIFLENRTTGNDASGQSMGLQRTLFGKFLKDMADARAKNNDTCVVMGFVNEESSGLGLISSYGIGLVPSDFYYDSTAFAGVNHIVYNAPVPRRPALANKVYIALYMSDGDNITYNQRNLRTVWRNETAKKNLGKIAMNWSFAPSAADIGPGLLNYFYDNMTEKDCMVMGPSGAQYFVPYCSNPGGGQTRGQTVLNEGYMNYFSKLTETYARRTGMRVVMASGGATTMVRSSLAQNCRSLYGYMIEDWSYNNPSSLTADPNTTAGVTSGVGNNKLYFERSRYTYYKNVPQIQTDIRSVLSSYDVKQPRFISYMMCVHFREDLFGAAKPGDWTKEKENSLDNLLKMQSELKKIYGTSKPHEFVRADHYFSYYYEANKLPFNLTMLAEPMTRVTASDKSNANVLCDGSNKTMWTAKNTGNVYVQFDFSKTYSISRYVIKHAETTGMLKNYNTREWKVEVSTNGTTWTQVDHYRENVLAETDVDIKPVDARYLRITILNSADTSTVRIANVEVYGAVK